jgi:hypothetical protein
MSLAIDVVRVREVLLPDGRWHEVTDASFDIDVYEYVRPAEGEPSPPELGAGQGTLVSITGARWLERDAAGTRQVFCPLTAIQAVSYGWPRDQRKK